MTPNLVSVKNRLGVRRVPRRRHPLYRAIHRDQAAPQLRILLREQRRNGRLRRKARIRNVGIPAGEGQLEYSAPSASRSRANSAAIDTAHTRKLYGLGNRVTEDFGRQCLMARRLSERGVRFVQVSHTYKWDRHAGLLRGHAQNVREADRPMAALPQDLKSRGLLEDTLVIWGGEFGRTPTAQGSDGRDHNPEAFTYLLARRRRRETGPPIRRRRRLRLLLSGEESPLPRPARHRPPPAGVAEGIIS